MQTTSPAGSVHDQIAVADLHIHPSMGQQLFRRDLTARQVRRLFDPNPAQSSFPLMLSGGYKLALSTLYVPEIELLDDFWVLPALVRAARIKKHYRDLFDPSPFRSVLYMADAIEVAASQVPDHRVVVVKNKKDLREQESLPLHKRQLALVHAVEGAHALDPDSNDVAGTIRRLETLADRGIASLTLVHFFDNGIAAPVYPYPYPIARLARRLKRYPSDVWRDLSLGLSPLGKAVVARMAELGMLIDMTHCTPTARREIYDIAAGSGGRATLVMTHVGVHALNPSPYNPEDWELKRIADTGGMVGTILMNYWLVPAQSSHSLDAVSATIRHVVNKGGLRTAGIGSDFDGFATAPDDLPDAGRVARITERLFADGYSRCQITQIMGQNVWSMLSERWGLDSSGLNVSPKTPASTWHAPHQATSAA